MDSKIRAIQCDTLTCSLRLAMPPDRVERSRGSSYGQARLTVQPSGERQGHSLYPFIHAANAPTFTASSLARRRCAGLLDSVSSKTIRRAYPL